MEPFRGWRLIFGPSFGIFFHYKSYSSPLSSLASLFDQHNNPRHHHHHQYNREYGLGIMQCLLELFSACSINHEVTLAWEPHCHHHHNFVYRVLWPFCNKSGKGWSDYPILINFRKTFKGGGHFQSKRSVADFSTYRKKCNIVFRNGGGGVQKLFAFFSENSSKSDNP